LGDSKGTYQHSVETPIHGTGQGSTASPSLWLMLSSMMMKIYSQMAVGMTMYSVDDLAIAIRQFLEGFVDDTANYTNNPDYNDDDINNLRNNLQEDGKKCCSILEASGGKLELSKTFYYLLTWSWDKYGNPIPQTISQQDNNHVQINLRPDGETPQYIQQREVTSSHKTLGVFKTICGKEEDHISYMKNKSDNLGAQLYSGQLNRRQARLAYSCHYIPAVIYSLPGTCIGEAALYIVQKFTVAKLLQISGFEERFPRAVVFGPPMYGGLGMRQIYTEGVCPKIECMICHIIADTSNGSTMINNLKWTQMQSGLMTPIMENFQYIDYIDEKNWFLHIREYIQKFNGKIVVLKAWSPTLIRENDFCIMDKIQQLELPKRNARIVNNWRMYFQVSSIANITNNTGDLLLEQYFDRRKVEQFTTMSKEKWPHQKRPAMDTFRIWKRVIKSITECDALGRMPIQN
jgi:hypothetical protein